MVDPAPQHQIWLDQQARVNRFGGNGYFFHGLGIEISLNVNKSKNEITVRFTA
jgi:hypothetical protein